MDGHDCSVAALTVYFMLESDELPREPTWPAMRDLFDQIIEKASGWEDATLIATYNEMLEHFSDAYPDVNYCPSDLTLALHDLQIPYERNEHNNKYYYLAKWK